MNYRDGLEKDAKVSPRCNPADFDLYNVSFVCEESGLEASLWYVVFVLFVLSMLSFSVFLFSINQEYWVTFLDTRTGKEFLCDLWRNGTADKERFHVFNKHKSYYKSINKELKEWLTANWDKWEEEKQDWFTAKMIGKIPSELLPNNVRKKLGSNVRERRKLMVAMIKIEKIEEAEKKKEKNNGK